MRQIFVNTSLKSLLHIYEGVYKIQNCLEYIIFAESCVQDLHIFKIIALSTIWKTYSAPL